MNMNGLVPVSNGAVTENGGGSVNITDRRAFNAIRINTNVNALTSMDDTWSQFITIPNGISPTELLTSPLLPNYQPFLTSGTLDFSFLPHEIPMFDVANILDGEELADPPPVEYQVSSAINNSQGANGNNSLGRLPIQQSINSMPPRQFSKEAPINSLTDRVDGNNMQGQFPAYQAMLNNIYFGQFSKEAPTLNLNNMVGRSMLTENMRGLEDGFNWIKYGHKHISGGKFSKRYYKCTRPDCETKKKVVCSPDGQVTKITYKGYHSHSRSESSRRPQLEIRDNVTSMENDANPVSSFNTDQRPIRTSLISDGINEISNPKAKGKSVILPFGTSKFPSCEENHNDYGVMQMQGITIEDNAECDESESKRRKVESRLNRTGLSLKAGRERKSIVRVESDVHILEDGYRWRKYGKKYVNGNPNPRSYYRCTTPGCSVRKYVERSAEDIKFMVHTYDGKHNHEVPPCQISTRANSIVANFPPPVTNVPPTVPFPSGTSASPISSFDRNIELSSEHFQQTLSPQMSDEANFEPYMYQMDDNPFELNSSYTAAQQPLSVPDFSVSSSNVSVSGTNFDENENFTSQFQPTSSEQQLFKENVMNF